ncbi:MAG: hypothetical protein ACRDPP_00105 [Gaiellaceae bacterium]
MTELPATPGELLLRLVEADENARPDRERFILFRVMGSAPGLPIQHPGLGEDGLHAREQDIQDLADEGYLRLTIRDKAWHFDITPQGFEHARKLRLAGEEARPNASAGGGLDWSTDVFPVLLAAGRAHSASTRPELGFTPEDVANTLGQARDQALDRILYELARSDYLEETIGADQSLVPLYMRATEKALQVTAGWPSASGEAALGRLLALIEARIADAATPEERGRWERLREGFAGIGRDAGAEMLGSLAAGFVRGLG